MDRQTEGRTSRRSRAGRARRATNFRDLIRDRSAPIGPRLAVVGLLLWLLNPIDLIPEFIPVLGPLDDVVVAVLVLRYVRRKLGEDAFRRRWPGSDEGYVLLARVL